MLRLIAFALALSAPALARAQPADQFPQSAIGVEVRAHDGATLGVVTSAERNAEGDLVAAEIPGLEPADAPRASPPLVAESDRAQPRVIRSRGESAILTSARASRATRD